LATILEEEGYEVEAVDTARKAIEKTKKRFHNVALIDIRLPDMEGIELLTKIWPTTPRTRKIIITGFPTLQNAVEAVNRGADAYIVKPFDVDNVLRTIVDQLKKQEQEKKYSEEKVAEFIETRVKQLDVEKEMMHQKNP